MNINFTYKPLPVHVPFHVDTAYERAMFGAFGSGKTYAIVAEAIAWCLEQPGIRGLIARKTAPELRDTVEPIFRELLPPELWSAGTERRAGGHMESFTFPNGSVVLFRSLDDWNKHRSLNIGFLAYDEANEIDKETYDGMASRVRQRDITAEARQAGYTHEITRRGIWLATNPNGHDWLYDHFVGPDKGITTSFFKSTTLDNPYLPLEYVERLLQYPEPWVRRYVLCQFDDFAGQVYEGWNWEDHVVEPYELGRYPRSHTFWMGFDPGTRSPSGGLWVCVDKEQRQLVAVAEYVEAGLDAQAHAQAWRAIEAKHRMKVSWRVADPNSVNNRDRGSNMALSDQYRRLGFHFQLGPSQEKVRIPMLGLLIGQRRFKVTKACPQTYEAIKNYRWEDLTPAARIKGIDAPEKVLKKRVELVDCAQYISSRWVAPPKLGLPELNLTPQQQLAKDVSKAVKKQLARKRKRRPETDLGHYRV